MKPALPLTIFSGNWNTAHVQGIAIDTARKYMYFSFTTVLVKTDLEGNIVGTVKGLTGHLGDLAFNDADGRVYGSLEYKSRNSFYIAIFDVDKIDRMGLDAETDGIMTAVYLPEVVKDYTADMNGDGVFDGNTADTDDHRYGCSGIDGTTFGPSFITPEDGKLYLTVAYGIFRNVNREDNDYQVILQYDTADFVKYEKPLNQETHHTSGPDNMHGKFFVFTGNTTYGIQNLEYDSFTGHWLMAVYNGTKEKYPNYPLYIIDGTKKAALRPVEGQKQPETGLMLDLLKDGLYDEKSGVYGWKFPLGQTGLIALGDGYYYISKNGSPEKGVSNSTVMLYKWNMECENAPFELVTE